jgi:WD40 repeat protein
MGLSNFIRRIRRAVVSPIPSALATVPTPRLESAKQVGDPSWKATILTGHTGDVRALSFSPNGQMLASVAMDRAWHVDQSIRFWDTETGKCIEEMALEDEPFDFSFSPDAKSGVLASTWISSSGAKKKGTFALLNLENFKIQELVTEPIEIATRSKFIDARRVVLAGRKQENVFFVAVYDCNSNEVLWKESFAASLIAGLDISLTSGLLAIGTWPEPIPLSNDQRKEVVYFSGQVESTTPINGPEVSSRASRDNVRLVDLNNFQDRYSFQYPGSVLDLAFSADGDSIAVTGGPTHIYRISTQQPKRLSCAGQRVRFLPSDNVVTGEGSKEEYAAPYENCRSRIWDINSDQLNLSFEGFKVPVDSLSVSQDGNFIACGGHNGQLVLWKRQ